jgi:hypothetical protein
MIRRAVAAPIYATSALRCEDTDSTTGVSAGVSAADIDGAVIEIAETGATKR